MIKVDWKKVLRIQNVFNDNCGLFCSSDCAYNNCEYLFLEDEEVGFCRKYFILTKNYLLCPDHRNKINLN